MKSILIIVPKSIVLVVIDITRIELWGQISRACCPNPFLSLRAPIIKNCNGRGVAISLYFMRLLRRCAPRNDILEFHMPEFDLGNTPLILNIFNISLPSISSTSRYPRYFQHLATLDIFDISLHSIFSTFLFFAVP